MEMETHNKQFYPPMRFVFAVLLGVLISLCIDQGLRSRKKPTLELFLPSYERAAAAFLHNTAADRAALLAWYGGSSGANGTALGIHCGFIKFGIPVPFHTVDTLVRSVDLNSDGQVSLADAVYGVSSALLYGYEHYDTRELVSTPSLVAFLDVVAMVVAGSPFHTAGVSLPPLTLRSAVNFFQKVARKQPLPWQRLGNMGVEAVAAVALETATALLPLLDHNQDGLLTWRELKAGVLVRVPLQYFSCMDLNRDGRATAPEIAAAIQQAATAAKAELSVWFTMA